MQVSNKKIVKRNCKMLKFQKMIVYISQITINVDLHSKVHYPNSDLCNTNPHCTVHLKIFLSFSKFENLQASVDAVRLFVIVPQRFHETAVTHICDKHST